MIFSTRVRYGLRFLICLASLPEGQHLQLRHVAAREDISSGYLEQIARQLKSANLICTARGSKGGYKLNKPPEDITLEEIFICLEGNFTPVACLGHAEQCQQYQVCKARLFWRDFAEHMATFMRQKTLADLDNADARNSLCDKVF